MGLLRQRDRSLYYEEDGAGDKYFYFDEEIAKDDSLGEGFCIGHSYFCNPDSYPAWIENIVKYEINPMLEEYWFDNKEKAETEKKKLLDLL